MNGREVQGGKTKTTENGILNLLFSTVPGLVPSGKVVDALGDLIVILPTCAELGGANLLKDFIFDGVSLADVVL